MNEKQVLIQQLQMATTNKERLSILSTLVEALEQESAHANQLVVLWKECLTRVKTKEQ